MDGGPVKSTVCFNEWSTIVFVWYCCINLPYLPWSSLDFHREDTSSRIKLAFSTLCFFLEKNHLFFQFSFFSTKIIFAHILCATFFLVKKDSIFKVLISSTIKLVFTEKFSSEVQNYHSVAELSVLHTL